MTVTECDICGTVITDPPFQPVVMPLNFSVTTMDIAQGSSPAGAVMNVMININTKNDVCDTCKSKIMVNAGSLLGGLTSMSI